MPRLACFNPRKVRRGRRTDGRRTINRRRPSLILRARAPHIHAFMVAVRRRRRVASLSPTRDSLDRPTIECLQTWPIRWSLGCVNPLSWLPLAARGEFTQPRARSFAQLCILCSRQYKLRHFAVVCRSFGSIAEKRRRRRQRMIAKAATAPTIATPPAATAHAHRPLPCPMHKPQLPFPLSPLFFIVTHPPR